MRRERVPGGSTQVASTPRMPTISPIAATGIPWFKATPRGILARVEPWQSQLAALDEPFADDGMSPQRGSENSRMGSLGF
jgi:hypothetical protein